MTSLAGRAVGASVDTAVTARASETVDGSLNAGVSSLRAVAAEGSGVREGTSRAERTVSGAVGAVGLRAAGAGGALALTDLVGVGVGRTGSTVATVGRVSSFRTEGTAISNGGVGLRTARAGVALDGSRAGGVGSNGTERAVQAVAGSSSRQTEVTAVVGESGLSSLGADGASTRLGVTVSAVGASRADETVVREGTSLTRAACTLADKTVTTLASRADGGSKSGVLSVRAVLAGAAVRREGTGEALLAGGLVSRGGEAGVAGEALVRASGRVGTSRAKFASAAVGGELTSKTLVAAAKVSGGRRTSGTEVAVLGGTSDLEVVTRSAEVTRRGGEAAKTGLAGVGEGSVTKVLGAVAADDVDVVKDEDLSLRTAAEADVIELEEDGAVKDVGDAPLELEVVNRGCGKEGRDIEGKGGGTSVVEVGERVDLQEDVREGRGASDSVADGVTPLTAVGAEETGQIPSDTEVPEEGESRDLGGGEDLKVAVERVSDSTASGTVPREGGGLVALGRSDVEEVQGGVEVRELVGGVDLKVKERRCGLGDGPAVLEEESSSLEASVEERLTHGVGAREVNPLRLHRREAG